MPEMFLLADSIVITLQNVTEGLVVFPRKIHSNLMAGLPFLITENIIMSLTARGVSRHVVAIPIGLRSLPLAVEKGRLYNL